MLSLTPLTRDEMRARWARVRRPERPKPKPQPRALNTRAVLDLGNTVYFTFRGRAYGIPPLAWRTGEQILDIWLGLAEHGEELTRSALPGYYDGLRRLQGLLWSACRPVGRFRRLLYRLGLHSNPLRRATEGELVELAVFTLGRRMSPPGALRPVGEIPRGGI